ncbi:CHAT domain-containing protein [Dyadobacter sp. CY356]|uniref:CHAT domain-containing protein n=1 Tax=Dyadobacter sp. CY356 TaxID=2906442 RepID=UPI001F3D4AB9|nr:CHAT domain-containing tetratricopeptide repeat protein [Dyadobacter sp. CY356]MCF0057860.1 CHAT domain-containing protein [Dyadobacter sp. CY356]
MATDPDSIQKIKLESWLAQWKKCYAVADSTYINALLQLGMAYRFAGDFNNAIKVTKKIIYIYGNSSKHLKKSDLVKANYRIGVYSSASQSTENAIKYLSEAVRIGKNDNESKTYTASAYLYLVYAYYVKGDFQKALSYADLGEEIATEIKDFETLAEILQQKAQALAELERNREAKTEVLKAIRIMQNLPEACYSLANQHRLLGDINRALHEKKEELAEYLLAYEIAEKCEHKNLSDFINAIGFYYYQNKDHDQALKYYQKALDVNKSAYSKGVLLDRMGLAYSAKKDYLKSLQYYQQGIRELLPAERLPEITSVAKAQSIKITAQKDYLLSLIQDQADTWLTYGQISKSDPVKLKNALKNYMLADTMIDFMRWEHTGYVSKLFWRNRTKAMYEHSIETCYLLKDPETALYFFEKSRAVMLNDQLNELGANQRLSKKDADQERMVRQKITDLQDQLSESKPGSKQYLRFRDELYNAQEEQQVFIRQLEKANPQYYSYKYDNHVPSLREVREKVVADGQTLISYFVGDSAVYGLGITKKGIDLKKIKLADYQSYNSKFQKLLGSREVQNKQFYDYLSVSNKLFALLIAPFKINSTRVIISPDGNFLPFESLSFSSEKPDFLVNKYAFSYTYSASFLAKMKRSEKGLTTTNAFLGMAPVQFSKKLNQASLPGSEIALEAINKHFFFSKSLTGQEASRSSFLKELSSHRIIQLLTHASADSTETEPTLYFADSTLTLSELSSSSSLSKTQLLVLSACRTGVGKNQKGEGVFSLARGFAGIGIPSTLTTLWSVENKSIYELTEMFYDQLEKGVPLDIALQQAQIEWLKTASKSDQLPYSWAGMVLVGNAEPVDMGFSKMIMYFIIASIAGLVLLLVFYLRKKSIQRKLSLHKY